MRELRRCIAVSTIVAAATTSAFAHGGTFGPGAPPQSPGPPLGPPWHPPHFVEPPATPGENDPKVAITRWETWWSANKDAFLRLAERLAGDAPNTSPNHVAPSEREQKAAEQRAEALRKRLAGVFVEALSDKEFEVRTAAAVALGKTGEASGSAPLRRAAMKDEHKDVRDSAVIGLGLLGKPTDIPFLEQMLFDRQENVRRRAFAAFALGLIGGDDAAVSLLRFAGEKPDERGGENFKKRPELAASTYIAMGLTGCADVLPVLRAAVIDGEIEEGTRSFAVISLGRMKDRASMQTIVTMLVSDRDAGLRRAAAVALGRIAVPADDRALDALIGAMHDERDPIARHFATAALSDIVCAKTRDALREEFKRRDEIDASFAALALGAQHDTDFAGEIRAALTSGKMDESSQGACCLALGLLGDVASAAAIDGAFANARHVWLKGYAALSLGLAGATSSVPSLEKKLEAEKDPRLRVNIDIALGLLRDPKAKSHLIDSLRGAETFYEKSSAALALGALRVTGAAEDIEAVYRDETQKDILRAFCVVALGEIADPALVPKLSRFSIDGNYDASVRVDPLNEILTIY